MFFYSKPFGLSMHSDLVIKYCFFFVFFLFFILVLSGRWAFCWGQCSG